MQPMLLCRMSSHSNNPLLKTNCIHDQLEEFLTNHKNYYSLIKRKEDFQELDTVDTYDGIWACASILHLSKEELPDVFCRMAVALRKNGMIYASFKYGSFEGERNGRYFTDFTEMDFAEFAGRFSELVIQEMWITGDIRPGRGEERWLNTILQKSAIC